MTMIYEAAPFFLTRFAALSFDDLQSTVKGSDLTFESLPFIAQQAIIHSNPKLVSAIEHKPKKGSLKGKKNVELTLIKYLSRMASRATPLGLFASVGMGKISTHSSMYFDSDLIKIVHSRCKKHLYQNVHQGQASANLEEKVLQSNEQIVRTGNRITLFEWDDNFKERKESSIALNEFIIFTLGLAKEPIPYMLLKQKILIQYPNIEPGLIDDYVGELLGNNFLLSDRTSILFQNPKSVIKTNFDAKSEMKIDCYYDSDDIFLHDNVGKALEQAATCLWKMAGNFEERENKIHHWFLEKYGVNELIPLLDLIDSPIIYNTFRNRVNRKSEFSYILNYIVSNSNAKQISLDDLSDKLPFGSTQYNYPPSIEIYFQIGARSLENLKNSQFKIVVTGGTIQGCSSFSRFQHFFSDDNNEQIKAFLKNEEALNSDLVFVDATFMPDEAKLANLFTSKRLRPYRLEINYHHKSSNTIELDDIYIGGTQSHLFAFSKKLNKEIFVKLTNTINPGITPLILQFLLHISSKRFIEPMSNFWEDLYALTYAPRITFKNIILSPARWNFSMQELNVTQDCPIRELEKKIQDLLIKFKVPDEVYLTNQEIKIWINWKQAKFFSLLVQEFVKNRGIVLVEQPIQNEEYILKDKHNKRYISEFVIPLLRKSKSKKIKNTHNLYYQTKGFENEIIFPGENWFYSKIYIANEQIDNFLSDSFQVFLNRLVQKFTDICFYYIRYLDPRSHIRLRIKAPAPILNAEIVPYINTWFKELELHKIIENISIEPYKREISRYGGKSLIEHAECFFFADSAICLDLLSKVNLVGFPVHILAAFGILYILDQTFSDSQLILEFLKSQNEDLKYLAGIRSISKKAVHYLSSHVLTNKNSKNLFTSLSEPLRVYNDRLGPENRGEIINNLIHMHCNRLLGPNLPLEAQARACAYYLFSKIIFKKNNQAIIVQN